MAKVKSLQPKLKEKAKNKAKQLRYKFAKTDEQKEFLDENPNVRTASEMEAAIAQNKRAEETQNRMSLPYATNVNFKDGGSVKLAKKGRGRAYGKNS